MIDSRIIYQQIEFFYSRFLTASNVVSSRAISSMQDIYMTALDDDIIL